MAEKNKKYATPQEKLAIAKEFFSILEKKRAGDGVDAYDVLVILAQMVFPGRKVQLTVRNRDGD